MGDQDATIRERFRSANDRLQNRLARLAWDDHIPFICECADGGCVVVVEVTRTQYESVRRRPSAYLVAPGHEQQPGAHVVDRGAGYVVVDVAAP